MAERAIPGVGLIPGGEVVEGVTFAVGGMRVTHGTPVVCVTDTPETWEAVAERQVAAMARKLAERSEAWEKASEAQRDYLVRRFQATLTNAAPARALRAALIGEDAPCG